MKSDYQNLFIAGGWRAPQNGSDEVINPATEAVIARAPFGGVNDCDAALAAARDAFDCGPWPRMHRTERVAVLRKLLVCVCVCVLLSFFLGGFGPPFLSFLSPS